MGKTARKAAWEIWAASRPARSSEYLRTTALGHGGRPAAAAASASKPSAGRRDAAGQPAPPASGRRRPASGAHPPTRWSRPCRSNSDRSARRSAVVHGEVRRRSAPWRRKTGSSPRHQPSARSGSLVTLPLAVWGRAPVDPHERRDPLGAEVGLGGQEGRRTPRDRRPVRAAARRPPSPGPRTGGRAPSRRPRWRPGRSAPGPARSARRSGSPSRPASSRPCGRRSRSSRPRRGRPGHRSSTSRGGSGPRWPPRRRSSPRSGPARSG